MTLAEVEEELQLRGGWLPLMHLFPSPEHHPQVAIPWTEADKALQQWLKTSSLYQEAIRDWAPT